jgi:hypothetical protein
VITHTAGGRRGDETHAPHGRAPDRDREAPRGGPGDLGVEDGGGVLRGAGRTVGRRSAARRPPGAVAPAQRSASARRKAQARTLDNGDDTHSFATLLADLATIQQTTCREAISGATFPMTTTPTAAQQHALDLLDTITV